MSQSSSKHYCFFNQHLNIGIYFSKCKAQLLLQRIILRKLTYQTLSASISHTLLSPDILRSMMCYRLWLVDFQIKSSKSRRVKEKFFCQGFVRNAYLSKMFRYRKNKMLTNTFVKHFQDQQADRQQIPTNQQLGVSMY